jgi:phosphatidylglycerol:prolipoprotein diacylglycerol transferase
MYGVVRFTMEFFRGDDIRGIYFALSTSQWISIILSFISLSVILLTSSRFKRNKKG